MSDETSGPFTRVTEVLDPILTPLGFAPGQRSDSEKATQVIYCRAHSVGDRRSVDVVIDVCDSGSWRISRVSIDDGPDQMVRHLRLEQDADLLTQLDRLASTIVEDVHAQPEA